MEEEPFTWTDGMFTASIDVGDDLTVGPLEVTHGGGAYRVREVAKLAGRVRENILINKVVCTALELVNVSAELSQEREARNRCAEEVLRLNEEVESLTEENRRLLFQQQDAAVRLRDEVRQCLAEEAKRILDSAPVIFGDNQLLARLLSEHLEFELRKLVDQGEKEE